MEIKYDDFYDSMRGNIDTEEALTLAKYDGKIDHLFTFVEVFLCPNGLGKCFPQYAQWVNSENFYFASSSENDSTVDISFCYDGNPLITTHFTDFPSMCDALRELKNRVEGFIAKFDNDSDMKACVENIKSSHPGTFKGEALDCYLANSGKSYGTLGA